MKYNFISFNSNTDATSNFLTFTNSITSTNTDTNTNANNAKTNPDIESNSIDTLILILS